MFDEKFLNLAIELAKKAKKHDEVPVGCVIVLNGKVIAKGYNRREKGTSVDHAEIIAIKKACKKIKDFRLNGCDIYVTLEPCPMCCGAIINARISNCYFGAYDKKSGYAKSLHNMFDDNRLNFKVNCEGGFKQEECLKLLQDFFKNKRGKKC